MITINPSEDVEFGRAVWDEALENYRFEPGGQTPTAVRVQVRMEKGSPNKPMQMLFAGIFGQTDKNMRARATAMIVPRDIAVVADLSGSMNDDSELRHYKDTEINLWNIWVCLPIEKGNNGVGNGIDPPPPGNPPVNDDYGTGPGNPGNRGGASPKEDPGLMGPTWGRMATWGDLILDGNYNPASDPGLEYLPYSQNWNDSHLHQWLEMVGYSPVERDCLTSGWYDWRGYHKYRVAVALGLARWDSGIDGGLWDDLPKGKTKNTKGDGDYVIEGNELYWMVDFPFLDKHADQAQHAAMWLDYISTYMASSATEMAKADGRFQYRYGLKTFVNYLLEKRPSYEQTPDLHKTPAQPLQAVKDAVRFCMDLLIEQEVNDQVSLEIYGTTSRHLKNLTNNFTQISEKIDELQAGHYDSWTNMGGGIAKAIDELTSDRARSNAAKVMFLMTDGQPNVDEWGNAGNSWKGQQWALEQAQRAVDAGIQIYCISVGADANRSLMQQIAEMGGGEEFYAAGTIGEYSLQLKQIFGELGSRRPVRLIH